MSNDRKNVAAGEVTGEDEDGDLRQGAWCWHRHHDGRQGPACSVSANNHSRRDAAARDRLADYFISPWRRRVAATYRPPERAGLGVCVWGGGGGKIVCGGRKSSQFAVTE